MYVICTPRPIRYEKGRSCIVYIGTTQRGVHRVAASMAHKAVDYLSHRGVKYLDVFAITCPPRPGLDTWRRLERDLLITFKYEYGSVPKANSSGKNFTPDKLSKAFQYRRLAKVLTAYSGC